MSSTTLPATTAPAAAPMEVRIDQNAVLKTLGLDLRDANAQALLLTCQRYNLDPVLKHMVLIQGRPYVTRDGLLHVAHASGKLDGIEVLDQAETPTHHTARVAVYRKDMTRPFVYIGRYPKNGGNKAYGPEMAVKCGEVMAMRRAFDVALCAREEMWDQAEDVPAVAHQPPPPDPREAINAEFRPAAEAPRPKDARPFGDLLADGVEAIAAEFRAKFPAATTKLPGAHQVARHCYRVASEQNPPLLEQTPNAKAGEVIRSLAGLYGTSAGRAFLRRELSTYLGLKFREAVEREEEALHAEADGDDDAVGDAAASIDRGDAYEGPDDATAGPR